MSKKIEIIIVKSKLKKFAFYLSMFILITTVSAVIYNSAIKEQSNSSSNLQTRTKLDDHFDNQEIISKTLKSLVNEKQQVTVVKKDKSKKQKEVKKDSKPKEDIKKIEPTYHYENETINSTTPVPKPEDTPQPQPKPKPTVKPAPAPKPEPKPVEPAPSFNCAYSFSSLDQARSKSLELAKTGIASSVGEGYKLNGSYCVVTY